MRKPQSNIPVICIALANERSDTGFLRGLTVELKEILNALEPAIQQGELELKIIPAATAHEIADAFQDPWLEGRIKVFHYAGHADEDELWLETDDGGNQGFTSLGLARFLGAQDSIRFVFLNGCATQLHADLLINNKIPATVVTAVKINDAQAITFSERFYKGLASGTPLENAFKEAEAFLLGITQNVKEDISRGLFWKKKKDEQEEDQFPWRIFTQEKEDGMPSPLGWRLLTNRNLAAEEMSVQEAIAHSMIGELIDDYKIVMLLGMGGTSMVYKGVHKVFHDEVAVKIIHSIVEGFEKANQILVEGVRGMRELKHPNVVQVIDGGPLDFQRLFIVREIVKGQRLDEVDFDFSARDRAGIDQAIGYGIQLCEGLKAAHNLVYTRSDGTQGTGLVHGNLKPSKVMFTPTQVAKINDFLFADLSQIRGVKFQSSGFEDEKGKIAENKAPTFTKEDYLPEEVIANEQAISKASDLFGLGATLIYLYTGKTRLSEIKPFTANTLSDLIHEQNPLFPKNLGEILYKAVHPDPVHRYSWPEELIKQLQNCISTSPKEVSVVDIVMAEAREDSSAIIDSVRGKVVSNYLIKDFLGEGTQGFVFRGVEEGSGNEAAIKITHRVVKGFVRAEHILEKNARAFKHLNHPHIAGAMAVGSLGNEEYLYVIREMVNGVRLDKLVQWIDEPDVKPEITGVGGKFEKYMLKVPELSLLGLQRLFQYALEICEGLRAAHSMEYIDLDGLTTYGIMHGNLKTRKVLITDQGPKIIDFMFGEIFNDPEILIATPRDIMEASLKKENPANYQPPEVVLGLQKPNKRTDVYALGAIFFEIIAGARPSEFKIDSTDKLHKFLLQRNPRFPELIARILFKALHPEPYLRYNTVSEMTKDIMKSTPAMFQVMYSLSSGFKRVFRK